MTLSAFLSVIVLLAIGFVVLYVLSIYLKYRKSSYKDASGNSFLQVLFDKGNYGEFLIFSRLEKLERHHQLLTNVYLRKSDGSTTEIDVMIMNSGLPRRGPNIQMSIFDCFWFIRIISGQ